MIFTNDFKRLKHSSYDADDLEIENLPLCQLYIIREELCK
jgi:hypothetical protein